MLATLTKLWKRTPPRRSSPAPDLDPRAELAVRIETEITARARRELIDRDPMRILVDNSVRGQCALTHTRTHLHVSSSWPGDEETTIPLVRRGVNPDVTSHTDWLIGIGALARKGLISLYESHALFLEQTYQKSGRYYRGPRLGDYNAFNNVQFRTLDSYPKPNTPPSNTTTVLKSFEGWDEVDPYGLYPNSRTTLRKGLKRAKSRFPRYREIESVLQGKSDQDAWHIFQADQFGIDYFLTVDREILEKARQRKGPFGNLGTTIVSPAQLGEALKLSPLVGEARNQWNWAITESFLNDPYRAADRDRRE